MNQLKHTLLKRKYSTICVIILTLSLLVTCNSHNRFYSDKYALKVRMPMQDVERIWNKYLYHTDPAFKAKIDAKIEAIKDKVGVRLKI